MGKKIENYTLDELSPRIKEEISEEIIPLLRQSGFYWIMKMRYLKINASLITALIERWRPETYIFHMRCEQYTITLKMFLFY